MKEILKGVGKTMLQAYGQAINPLLPPIRTLFKKYLGKYFNEQLQLDQITGMGLKNLTLKPSEINYQMDPTFPFVVESGTLGLIKLDLKHLTLVVDRVDITLNFKTPQELHEIAKIYKKNQDFAQQLEKMKQECLRSLKQSASASTTGTAPIPSSGGNKDISWDIVKKFLKNVKVNASNIRVNFAIPLDQMTNLTFMMGSCQFQTRRLSYAQKPIDLNNSQEEFKDASTSMTATLCMSGIGVYLFQGEWSEESCILNLCSNPREERLTMNLKVDVKERLKYSSTIQMKHLEISMSKQQLMLMNRVVAKVGEVQQVLLKASRPDQIIKRPAQVENNQSEIYNPRFRWIKEPKFVFHEDWWDNVPRMEMPPQLSQEPSITSKPEISASGEKGFQEETIATLNNLLDISQQESQFNQSRLEPWEESDIKSTDKSEYIQDSQLMSLPNVPIDEKALKELDKGNLIMSFKLDLLLVTVRYSNRYPITKERWLYAQKRDYRNLKWFINCANREDHLALMVRGFNLRMDKKKVQTLMAESQIVKNSEILVGDIHLVDIKSHIFERREVTQMFESCHLQNVEDPVQFDEDSDEYMSAGEEGEGENMESIAMIAQPDQEFQRELTLTKNEFFGNVRRYYSLQRIFSISDELPNKKGVLVKCVKLNEEALVFFQQPDQIGFLIDGEVEPIGSAIKMKVRHKDASASMSALITVGQIHLLVQAEQIAFCQDFASPGNARTISPVQQQEEAPSHIQVQVAAVNVVMILDLSDPVEIFFFQLVQAKQLHLNDGYFRYQLYSQLLKHKLESLTCTINGVKLQKQGDTIMQTFNGISMFASSLNSQSSPDGSITIAHQTLMTVSSKKLVNENEMEVILQPIVRIKGTAVSIGLPLVEQFMEATFTRVLSKCTQLVPQSRNPNVQTNSNAASKMNINLFIDELKVFCADGHPIPKFQFEEVRADRNAYKQQPFVCNQTVLLRQRLGVHISKMHFRATKTIELGIYNIVVWDQVVKSEETEYGSFRKSKPDPQYLKFRKCSYNAQQVLFYKQDRSNREKFSSLLSGEDMFPDPDRGGILTLSEIDIGYEQPQHHCIHLDPNGFSTFLDEYRQACIVNVQIKEQQEITIELQNAIITIDKHLQHTIPYIERFAKTMRVRSTKPSGQSNPPKLNLVVQLNNIWISLFPTYTRGSLLLQNLKTRAKISRLKTRQPQTSYYSWVRSVIVLEQQTLEVSKTQSSTQIKCNVRKLAFYVKNASDPHIPYSNPVLLVQPELILYRHNRKVSESAFQVDNSQLELLDQLNFLKVGVIKDFFMGCTSDQRIKVDLKIQRIKAVFKHDSLKATLLLVDMIGFNLKRKYAEQPSQPVQTPIDANQETNIQFGMDGTIDDQTFRDKLKDLDQFQLELRIVDVQVTVYEGHHFYSEAYQLIESEDFRREEDLTILKVIERNDGRVSELIGYEIYHLDFGENSKQILQVESNTNKRRTDNHIRLAISNIACKLGLKNDVPKELTLQASIQDAQLIDNLRRSKFSKIFAKEVAYRLDFKPPSLNLLTLDFKRVLDMQGIPMIVVDLALHPIRVCLHGTTFEFVLRLLTQHGQWVSVKDNYDKELARRFQVFQQQPMEEQVQLVASEDGFDVVFSQEKYQGTVSIAITDPVRIERLLIHRTKITLSIDGYGVNLQQDASSINLNRGHMGLMRVVTYNNLELGLRQAMLRNRDFAKQEHFFREVMRAYKANILENQEFRSAVYLQFKALQNVSQIYFGQSIYVISRFRDMVQTAYREGLLVGLQTRTMPIVKAIADELVFLAKKPFDMCDVISESVGLTPLAEKVIRPVGNALQSINDQLSTDTVPIEFLKP